MADIVFFDGDCPMCNGLVLFLAKRDKGLNLKYAPLKGETYLRRLTPGERSKIPDTLVVLRREGQILIRSNAVLYILNRLGGKWRVLSITGMIFPTFLRDAVYRMIAFMRPQRRDGNICEAPPDFLRRRLLP